MACSRATGSPPVCRRPRSPEPPVRFLYIVIAYLLAPVFLAVFGVFGVALVQLFYFLAIHRLEIGVTPAKSCTVSKGSFAKVEGLTVCEDE